MEHGSTYHLLVELRTLTELVDVITKLHGDVADERGNRAIDAQVLICDCPVLLQHMSRK
jgi:hypothetical protein